MLEVLFSIQSKHSWKKSTETSVHRSGVVSRRSDLTTPSQTMQLSLCLNFSVIKILCSPETQGEGLRLSLSRAHTHDNTQVHVHTDTQTHKQSRSLQQKRGSQATVYTVGEEIVNNVSLLGGYFGVNLFASQRQTHFGITCILYIHIYIHISIYLHQNDNDNRKARFVTCPKNC